MFLELRDFLNPAEIARLVQFSQELRFVEGRLSNPHNTAKVNLQSDQSDPRYQEAAKIVVDAFQRCRPFRDFAYPKRIAPPLLSRYEPGMKYGPHADTSYMTIGGPEPFRLRSDLSCTIFLNDPASYEGGELVLHVGTMPIMVKGRPGDAFIYPSTLVHEVRPVTSGTRLVSVTFIESVIPEERQRNTLYELQDVLALEGLKMDYVSRVRMEVVIHNLIRLWSVS